ncbi:hypothetical protein IP87_09595 [beta proteobacterium AAP121]|nr:hypothetical protein IP80_09050 [beta proteobacterium AAP65]KPF97993.1 hypothetical protein IP87_09595 [beta proteobacterium AAP121]
MRWCAGLSTIPGMKTTTLKAQFDVLQAAVLALAASLPPERADLTRRMFVAAVADLDDRLEHDAEADAAASGVVGEVLATLEQARAG